MHQMFHRANMWRVPHTTFDASALNLVVAGESKKEKEKEKRAGLCFVTFLGQQLPLTFIQYLQMSY